MKPRTKWIIAGLASSLLAAASAPSFATAVWTNNATAGNSCTSTSALTSLGANCTVVSDGGSGTTTLAVTAIADTGAYASGDTKIAAAYIGYYGGNGFGISRATGNLSDQGVANSGTEPYSTAPNHAMDNFENREFFLYQFGAAVTLSQITLGYSSSDSDLTVLAYTGCPSGCSATLIGDTYDDLVGNTAGKGWTLIGNYMNVGGAGSSASISTSVSSSYWLIGAYNSLASGNLNASDGLAANANKLDYVKILSVAGTTTTTTTQVPEPSSLLLAAIALFGLTVLQRRRAV